MKKLFTFLFLVAVMLYPSLETWANDDCSNATPIQCGQTLAGSTIGANFDGISFCGTTINAPGVWYTVQGNGGQYTASTCNQASYDTKISIFEGSCGALSCVTGQDDAIGCSGFTTEVDWQTTAGTTYYILIHGFGGATGNFNLSVDCGNPPAGNDVCSGAIDINCNTTVSGSTVGTNVDLAPFCGTSNTAPGVWYHFAGDGSCVTATTCGSGTNYDTKLTVFEGNCNGLSCVGGNDDDFSCAFGALQSTVEWTSTAGTDYYILVHGYSSATGNFDLTLSCVSGPPNDDVCNATPIGVGSTLGFDNECSSAQPGEVSPGAGTGNSSCDSQDGWCSFETGVQTSLWYTFEAPESGCVSISAVTLDMQLAVYTADDCNDFSTFNELAANDDGGPGLSPLIDQLSCLTPGKTYYIQLDGYSGIEGQGTITVTDCGNAPLEVDAGECQTRILGYDPLEAEINYLIATASGGFPPYTYSWSPAGLFTNGDGSGLAVQPNTTTTYTVTVTDSRGCTVTDMVTVNVIDANCGNNGDKVLVCHRPPGNPNNTQLICISENAVPAHVDGSPGHSGCTVGACDIPCSATNPPFAPAPVCVDLTINLTTDDFANETSWRLMDVTDGTTIDSRAQGSLTSATNYVETYCVDPTHCYEFEIGDSFGDGICCGFGLGSYSITFDGINFPSPSGGAFGSSETIQVGMCQNFMPIGAPTNKSVTAHIKAYPNPTATQTYIEFGMEETGMAVLEVYNMSGQKVATLFNGLVQANDKYKAIFDAAALPDGIYFCRLTGPTTAANHKIAIAK